jgi:prepilin-type N-terminal cleavage/methylation domain-containing protein
MRPVRRAFTLIELLVVISIIAVLLAILMPSLRKARDATRLVVCKSNLRNIHTAMSIYADDYGDLVTDPRGSTKDATDPMVMWQGNGYQRWCRKWYLRFYPYLQTPKSYVCPAWHLSQAVPHIEFLVGDKTFYVTYTANEYVMSFFNRDTNSSTIWKYTELVRDAAHDNWMSLIFGDGIYEVNGWQNWRPREWFDDPATLDGRGSYRHSYSANSGDRKKSRGQANFMAADGHIGTVQMLDVAAWPKQGNFDEFKPSALR